MDEFPVNFHDKADMSYSNECPSGAVPITAPNRGGAIRSNLGFTLVELLVVLALLAILASIAISALGKYRGMARNNRAMSEIHMLANAISGFYADRGFYPTDLTAVGYGNILDPWGQPYRYERSPTRLFGGNPVNSDYDLWSEGENGAIDAASFVDSDDIIRTQNGTRIGMANRYGTPDY